MQKKQNHVFLQQILPSIWYNSFCLLPLIKMYLRQRNTLTSTEVCSTAI